VGFSRRLLALPLSSCSLLHVKTMQFLEGHISGAPLRLNRVLMRLKLKKGSSVVWAVSVSVCGVVMP